MVLFVWYPVSLLPVYTGICDVNSDGSEWEVEREGPGVGNIWGTSQEFPCILPKCTVCLSVTTGGTHVHVHLQSKSELMILLQDSKYTMKERTMLILFLVYCFNSLVCLIHTYIWVVQAHRTSSNLLNTYLEAEKAAFWHCLHFKWLCLCRKLTWSENSYRD